MKKLFTIFIIMLFFSYQSKAQQAHQFKLDTSLQNLRSTFDLRNPQKNLDYNPYDYKRFKKGRALAEKAIKIKSQNGGKIAQGSMPNFQPEGLYPMRIFYPDSVTRYSLIIIKTDEGSN